MYPRTNYEMTEADLVKLLDAMKPVPLIMLHIGGGPRSQQDRANDAWAELGSRMGFDYMTVKPSAKGDRFFTAVPSETESHKKARLEREADEKRQQMIAVLRTEIAELTGQLETMQQETEDGAKERARSQEINNRIAQEIDDGRTN